jgi:hypothetical protein
MLQRGYIEETISRTQHCVELSNFKWKGVTDNGRSGNPVTSINGP